jgi:hypothetical protein
MVGVRVDVATVVGCVVLNALPELPQAVKPTVTIDASHAAVQVLCAINSLPLLVETTRGHASLRVRAGGTVCDLGSNLLTADQLLG